MPVNDSHFNADIYEPQSLFYLIYIHPFYHSQMIQPIACFPDEASYKKVTAHWQQSQ